MPAYDFTIDLGGTALKGGGEISARHYAPKENQSLGATYVLAPGASRGHDHAFIVEFGTRLSARGLDVVTFNFPFLERGAKKPDGTPRLEQSYRAVVERVGSRPALATQPILVGGKSMGGRIASYLAARTDGFPYPVAGLIFLGYPLHAPQRPEQLQVAHFPEIKVPMLFVQGTRDPFGTPAQLEAALSLLETPVRVHQVIGGDHSFGLPKKQPGGEPQVFDDVANAVVDWVRTVVPEG
jgi:uncharacterized protein